LIDSNKLRNRTRINLREPKEVEHWTKELGVDKWDLARLVRKVGTTVAAVRKELGKSE
jgi:hypothetical protein